MAAKVLTTDAGSVVLLSRNIAAALPGVEACGAVSSEYHAYAPVAGARDVVLMLENSGETAGSAVICAGDSVFAGADLTVTLAAGAIELVAVETGRFAIMSGENAGYIKIKGSSGSVKAGAILAG